MPPDPASARLTAALCALLCTVSVLSACTRQYVLGSDDNGPEPTKVPVATASATQPGDTQPRESPTTGRLSTPWNPALDDWRSAMNTLAALLDDPGCQDSQELATRLDRVWQLWYGKTNRVAQPDYESIVLNPIQGITERCGAEYATNVYRALGYESPGIAERIRNSQTGEENANSSPTDSRES